MFLRRLKKLGLKKKQNLGGLRWRAWLLLVLLVLDLISGSTQALASPLSQADDPGTKALALLDRLSPEERVGQLFLVTFTGAKADAERFSLLVSRCDQGQRSVALRTPDFV